MSASTPARLGYYDNYLVDNHSCVIVGVQATAARMSQETVAAQDMIARFAQWQGRTPVSVAADTTYYVWKQRRSLRNVCMGEAEGQLERGFFFKGRGRRRQVSEPFGIVLLTF